MLTLALLAGAVTMTAGCSSRPEPAPQPAVRPQIAPPRVVAPPITPAIANWQDQKAAAGDWVWKSDARGSVALFGAAGADATFLIRCEREGRRVFVSRAGAFAVGETGRMTIRTTSALQTYPVANANTAPPYISAALNASDPHLDAMMYTRGKFLISVKGGDDLIIPAWAEISRVIEDCR
jgi:hypothetical protein